MTFLWRHKYYDIDFFFIYFLVHFISFPKIYRHMGFIDIYYMSFLIMRTLCFFVQISKIILVSKDLKVTTLFFYKFKSFHWKIRIKKECTKFRRSHVIVSFVGHVPSCRRILVSLVGILCVKNLVSWVLHGFKIFLVSILLFQHFFS